MKFTYLLIDLITISVPFIFSFHPQIKFYAEWKRFFPAALITAVVFIAWDIYFTGKNVWWFNDSYVTGWNFFNLPVEEILFFFCIPYACVFTYHCLTKFYNLQWKPKTELIVALCVAILLLALGILHADKLYTSYTFISTAVILLALKLLLKVTWIGKAMTVYAVLLIPFFIVNGLLTGTGLEEAVVLYNNDENMGIRILTIPIEDAVYGFELFIINLLFYELFSDKKLERRG